MASGFWGAGFGLMFVLALTHNVSLVCPLGLCDVWFLSFDPSIIIIDGNKKKNEHDLPFYIISSSNVFHCLVLNIIYEKEEEISTAKTALEKLYKLISSSFRH